MAESTDLIHPVPAIDKAARVLRALADGGRPQGISELARGLNVSKGTLRDVLLTLAHHGFVVRDPDTRFRLGPELRSLADASAPDLRALAQPYLVSLMESFGETAILGLVIDGKLEIAARAEPGTDLHMTAPSCSFTAGTRSAMTTRSSSVACAPWRHRSPTRAGAVSPR